MKLLTEFSGFSIVAFAHLLTRSYDNVIVASFDRVATHIVITKLSVCVWCTICTIHTQYTIY